MNRVDHLFEQFLRERTCVNNITNSTREWYQCAWTAFTRAQASRPERADAFCRWLHEQNELLTLVELKPQRLEKRIIRTHGEAALRAILSYRPKTFEHWRVHALVCSIHVAVGSVDRAWAGPTVQLTKCARVDASRCPSCRLR